MSQVPSLTLGDRALCCARDGPHLPLGRDWAGTRPRGCARRHTAQSVRMATAATHTAGFVKRGSTPFGGEADCPTRAMHDRSLVKVSPLFVKPLLGLRTNVTE